MIKNEYGIFETFLPNNPQDNSPAIPHHSKVKISLVLPNSQRVERIPAWISRVEQDQSVSPLYEGIFWNPPQEYVWQHQRPALPPRTGLKIYEAHVGIASPEGKVSTYDNFTDTVLPRIKRLGYNCIQLMAIMEHAYYASFGYQITSFFAISSRYGLNSPPPPLPFSCHSPSHVFHNHQFTFHTFPPLFFTRNPRGSQEAC